MAPIDSTIRQDVAKIPFGAKTTPHHRVLVVDDDHDDFYVVERLMGRVGHCGYDITHVDNFDDALDALRSARFDVALLDYFIGDRHAAEVVSRLGNEVTIPIIMLTGKDISGTEREALHAGAFDFLDKNELTPAALARSIDFALNRFQVEFQLRRSEERLRAAREEADQANRTKSEFLAQMSHELRTPLNAILGYSEIIKDDVFANGISVQYREYADAVYSSGHHLLNLINDLLDLSKIEAGAYRLSLSEIEILPVIESTQTLFAPVARERGIDITCTIAAGMTHIRADERALKQIIVNLISNAVKFSPDNGTVMIVTRDTSTTSTIEVIDHGIGIRPEEMDVALTPFEQTSGAAHAKGNGTGLGLPITKLLVEQHGGTLKLESAPEQGTRVTLQFPKIAQKGVIREENNMRSSMRDNVSATA